MKRIFWMTFLGLGAAVLGGCPIYSDNGTHRICDSTGCWDCPNGSYSDSCTGWQCSNDSDCPGGYACSAAGYCVVTTPGNPVDGGGCTKPSDCPPATSCGTDNQCHPGDCTTNGCPAPLVCKLSNGTPQCVALGTDGGPPPIDGGGDGPVFSGCHNDSECISLGPDAKCLDGVCVAPANQCSDTGQCPNQEQCVNGVCTPACDATHPCPTGYSCDPKGVCTGNPNPCGSTGQVCPNGTTCVDTHCVQPCGAGNSCPTGDVCVDGGCIPDQQPQFICNVEGAPGNGQPGYCAQGSICLHHNCYIACNPEAGQGACKTADQYNVCKSVTTSTGSYFVCGSSTSLGSECDPTQGKACTAPGAVCIDGYCK